MIHASTRSVSFRLNTLFLVIVTSLLVGYGALNYFLVKREKESELERSVAAISKNLEANLAKPMWDNDLAVALVTIKPELGARLVQSITVTSLTDIKVGVGRNKNGDTEEITDEPAADNNLLSREGVIRFDDAGKLTPVGKYRVSYSRSEVEMALANAWRMTLAQILILDTALLIALSFALRAMVTRPLQRIRDALKTIAEGEADLTRRLDESKRDEFSEVGHWFNLFVTRIHGVISEVGLSVAEQLGTAKAMNEASARVQETSMSQYEAVQSSASAVERMSVSISHIVDGARNVETDTLRATATASGGATSARMAAGEIEKIAASIASVSEKVGVLVKRSSEIGGIVNVIKDIADQTNLLALNAAIEAARAGEQGRGFAVVADEVRKLAERTTTATKEIHARITEVQHDTSQAVVGIDDANSKIAMGVEITQAVAEALSAIESNALQTVQRISSISDSIKEQSGASQNIARNIDCIAAASDANKVTADTTKQLSADLVNIADRLDATIHRFIV